jgi:hypothetical protein
MNAKKRNTNGRSVNTNVKRANILLLALLLSGCNMMRKQDSGEVSKNAPVFIRSPASVAADKKPEAPKLYSFNTEPLVIMKEADLNRLVERAKTNAPGTNNEKLNEPAPNNEKVNDILLNKPEEVRPVAVTSDLQVQTVGVSPFLQEQTVVENRRSAFAIVLSYLAVAAIAFGFLLLVKKFFFASRETPAATTFPAPKTKENKV